jgi:hypothetical protein
MNIIDVFMRGRRSWTILRRLDSGNVEGVTDKRQRLWSWRIGKNSLLPTAIIKVRKNGAADDRGVEEINVHRGLGIDKKYAYRIDVLLFCRRHIRGNPGTRLSFSGL